MLCVNVHARDRIGERGAVRCHEIYADINVKVSNSRRPQREMQCRGRGWMDAGVGRTEEETATHSQATARYSAHATSHMREESNGNNRCVVESMRLGTYVGPLCNLTHGTTTVIAGRNTDGDGAFTMPHHQPTPSTRAQACRGVEEDEGDTRLRGGPLRGGPDDSGKRSRTSDESSANHSSGDRERGWVMDGCAESSVGWNGDTSRDGVSTCSMAADHGRRMTRTDYDADTGGATGMGKVRDPAGALWKSTAYDMRCRRTHAGHQGGRRADGHWGYRGGGWLHRRRRAYPLPAGRERREDRGGIDDWYDWLSWCHGRMRSRRCRRDPPRQGKSPPMRIGEATNPGPAISRMAGAGDGAKRSIGPLSYADPTRPGFHGALLQGGIGHDNEAGGSEGERYGLSIETCNATAWGPLRRYLRRTSAHVVLAQEHHLGPSDIPAKTQWAIRAGWHCIFAPAQRGEGDGWRAGVAIFAKPHVGLSLPRVGSHIVVPHRAVAASIQPPGYRRMTIISMYLEDGKAMGPENLEHLRTVGNFIASQGDMVPFVAGGDMQVAPEVLAATEFASTVNGEVVASACPRGTCRTTRTATELDFFVVHKMLAVGIHEVRTIEDAGTRPHVPVHLSFIPRLTTARAMVVRMPPPITTERVFGPLPPPPSWEQAAAHIKDLVGRARGARFAVDDEFRDELELAYQAWADVAEIEIEAAAADAPPVVMRGLRGRRPALRWRSVLPERPPPPPADEARLTQWRNIANLVTELKRVVYLGLPTNADDDDGDDADSLTHTNLVEVAEAIKGQARDMTTDEARAEHVDAEDGTDEEDDGGIRYFEAVIRVRALATELARWVRRCAEGGVEYAGSHGTAGVDYVRVVDELADQVSMRLDKVASRAKKVDAQKWREWVTKNLQAGARNAHRYLRLPEEWRPVTVLDPDGVATAAPTSLVEGYAAKYNCLWNGGGVDVGGSVGTADVPWQGVRNEPMTRPTPADIRGAARSFPLGTAVAYDGFAMRQYEWLSDEALEALADVIEIVERTGELPRQLTAIAMPMLAKPRGGHRAVATFVSLYRLWTRIRREDVREWECTVDRPYFAAASGRSPQDAVWRQAAQAEAAVAKGECSAALLWDVASFFESIRRRPLWYRARRLHFPTTIAAVAFNAYSSVRMLSLAGAMSKPLFAHNGVPAGCTFAMAFTKAYCIEAFDRATEAMSVLAEIPPSISIYVDDISITAQGSAATIIDIMTQAERIIREEVEGALACTIEVGKAAVIASTRRVAAALRERFGEYAGPPVGGARPEYSALNLGVDFAPGRSRRMHGRGSKRNFRFARLRRQAGKIARLRTVAGKRTSAIFVSGPLPAAVYGAAVNGLSDREVLQLRRVAACASSPRARGRSLRRLLLLLTGIATWRAEVEVILQYARETWRAAALGHRCPAGGQLTLSQISRLWAAVGTERIIVSDGKRRVWAESKGPIGALHLSLHRIGWRMTGPFALVSDKGVEVVLTKVSPCLLSQMLREAVMREVQRSVGTAIAREDSAFDGRRVATEHVASQLKGDKKMTARDKAAYRAVACGAVMTYDKASAQGYDVVNLCPKCRRARDTVYHRVWKCQHEDVVRAREAAAPSWLCREAENLPGAATSVFWTTGFFPHPAEEWPGPSAGDDAVCEWHGDGMPGADDYSTAGKPHTHGQVYIDGSCTANVFAELRRAAASVVQWSAVSGSGWCIKYPVPNTLPQTPQAGEYVAVALAKQTADLSRRFDAASDCLNVVRDLTTNRMAATSWRRAYAGINKEVLSDGRWRRMATIRKVPAHVKPEAAKEGQERHDAIGNGYADRAAKSAVELHDAPSPAQVTELTAKLRRARIVVRTVAAVIQVFDPMPKERMRRLPRPSDGTQVDAHGGHKWSYGAGFWRCTVCMRLALSEELTATHLREKCDGQKSTLAASAITDKGHRLAKTAGEVPIVFCVSCGSFATRRAYGLAADCPGRPTSAGKQAIARIRAGKQPWGDRGRAAERRLTSDRPMAWDRHRQEFVHIGPVHRSTRRRAAGTHPAMGKATTNDDDRDRDSADPRGRRRSGQRMQVNQVGEWRDLDDDGMTDARGGVDADEHMEQLCAEHPPEELELCDDDVFGHGGSLDQGQDDWRPHDAVRDGCSADRVVRVVASTAGGRAREGQGDTDASASKRVRLNDDEAVGIQAEGVRTNVAVARVGPRGAVESDITVVAVPNGAAATVVSEAAATTLDPEDDACVTQVTQGEVARNPASGFAAPLDMDSGGVRLERRRRDDGTSSQGMPYSEGGGSPRKRRNLHPPQEMPIKDLGAGLRHEGLALRAGDGEPPRGEARRRDGDGDPSPRVLAARRRDAAAEPGGSWERPQRGLQPHARGAQHYECNNSEAIWHGMGGHDRGGDAAEMVLGIGVADQVEADGGVMEVVLRLGGSHRPDGRGADSRVHRHDDDQVHRESQCRRGGRRLTGDPHRGARGPSRRDLRVRGPVDTGAGTCLDGPNEGSALVVSSPRSIPPVGNGDRDVSHVGDLGGPSNRDAVPPQRAERQLGARGVHGGPGGDELEGTDRCQPVRGRPGRRGDPRRCDDEARYIMPWERPPAWLYPRPDVELASGDRNLAVEWPRIGGSAVPVAIGGDASPARAEGEPAAGGEVLGQMADGEIRGHSEVPGAASSCDAEGALGEVVRAGSVRIRGPADGLGPKADGVRRRQQERLEARNAHIARSLEDHAERVERKRRMCTDDAERMTPRERLAALRRRVTQKNLGTGGSVAPHRDGGGNLTSATCNLRDGGGGDDVGAQRSTEDHKIHYDEGGGDEADQLRDPAGRAAGGRQPAAMGHAASLVAWHSRGHGAESHGAGQALT